MSVGITYEVKCGAATVAKRDTYTEAKKDYAFFLLRYPEIKVTMWVVGAKSTRLILPALDNWELDGSAISDMKDKEQKKEQEAKVEKVLEIEPLALETLKEDILLRWKNTKARQSFSAMRTPSLKVPPFRVTR